VDAAGVFGRGRSPAAFYESVRSRTPVVRRAEGESDMTHRSAFVRLAVSAAAGLGAALVTALVAAVIELYLTGHGYGSINREIITLAPAGVHLSIGDVGVLAAGIAAALATWYQIGRDA